MPRHRRISLILTLVLAAGHLALYLEAGPVDDDFICYRYARNLAEGQGLVYQPGVRIEGFTNPLWVLLHAGGQRFGLDPVGLTRWLALLAALAGVWIAAGVERRLSASPDAIPLAPFGLALSPALAFHGAAGLGTTLLGTLILGWFGSWLVADERGRPPILAAILLACACLLRQEALLFALPFAVRVKQRVWGRLPLFAFASWTLLRVLYYGELLPQTFFVKRLPLARDLSLGWHYLVISTLTAGAGVYVAASLAAIKCVRVSTGLVGAACLGLVLHVVYVVAVGGDYLALARFYVPGLPLAITLAAVALSHRPLARGLLGLFTLALLWTHLPPGMLGKRYEQSRPYLKLLHEFQEQRWTQLGEFFAQAAPASSVVCLAPIGAFGWESRLEIVDVLGLVTPGIAAAEPDLSISMKGHQRYDAGVLMDAAPDYLIPGNGVRDPRTGRMSFNPWERDLAEEPRFLRHYIQHVVPIPGGEPLDVWIRQGSEPLPGARRVP